MSTRLTTWIANDDHGAVALPWRFVADARGRFNALEGASSFFGAAVGLLLFRSWRRLLLRTETTATSGLRVWFFALFSRPPPVT